MKPSVIRAQLLRQLLYRSRPRYQEITVATLHVAKHHKKDTPAARTGVAS